MSNTFRFFVLALVLVSFAGTSAALQLNAHQRIRERLNKSEATQAIRATVALIQLEQQRVFLIMMGAGLASVVIIAILPASRRESPVALERIRNDMAQVDRLARTTITQADELTHERDTRIRTEEMLHLKQMRLNQILEEKIRLGRDLHDGIIQSLYATGLTLESARQKHVARPDEADALLERGVNLLNATIRDVRRYIEFLGQTSADTPASLDIQLKALLDTLCSPRSATFSVRVDEFAEAKLDESQRTELIQIIREAASNSLRHGDAHHITVRLHEDGVQLAILIHDDGHGFDPKSVLRPGLGLSNIRARTSLLQGDMNITSQPGAGTRVVITFPVIPKP